MLPGPSQSNMINWERLLFDQRAEELKEKIHHVGRESYFVNDNAALDDTRQEAVQELARRMVDPPGTLRVLMHLLAFGALKPLAGAEVINRHQLELTADVMGHSLVYWVQACLKAGLMDRGARIFAMTSIALEGVEVASRIRSNTRLIWCESPGSITMEVQDVPAIVEAAHRRDVLVTLDNTWAAGVLFDAFGHGADFSVQAVTKYIGGHSDLLLGSVTVRNETLYQRLGPILSHLGMVVSPDDCSLALRGLQTLHVRLKPIEESALRVASWFAGQPDVETVLHPALPSCPGHITWRRDFTGSSGLFSVVFRPPLTRHDLHARMDRLKLFRMGYSWGGVSRLVVTPDLTEAPNAWVYGERLVRFYIGLEDADDLISDVEQAFRR